MKTNARLNAILMTLMLGSAVFVSVMVGQTLTVRQDPTRAREFMRQKLAHGQNILEGLALENYELIITNGIKMFDMSQNTQWRMRSTDEYQRYSADFSERVAAMIDAARDKRIKGSLLSVAASLLRLPQVL